MSPNTPDISVIIVNYQVKEYIALLIKSLKEASECIEIEVIVINNSVEEKIEEFLKSRFSDVIVIENEKNKGFATANNQGIEISRGKYIYLVNPDVIIKDDTLIIFKKFMDENPEYGIVSCKIINPDGSFARESKRSDPDLRSAFYRVMNLDSCFPEHKEFGKRYLGWIKPFEDADVPVVSGANMFCRSEELKKIGGFDEDFFMYGEDDDLCLRMRNRGNNIKYLSTTTILHFKGESQKVTTFTEVKKIQKGLYRYFEKHYGDGLFIGAKIFIKFLFNAKVSVGYFLKSFKYSSGKSKFDEKAFLVSNNEHIQISNSDLKNTSELKTYSEEKLFQIADNPGLTKTNNRVIFDTESVRFKSIFRIIKSFASTQAKFSFEFLASGRLIKK